jgi:curved DNA-binding protein CbpA
VQGDLTLDSLGDVIRKLYVNRRSGILHLARGETSKRIYFRKGSMIFANSDVDADRLGEFLIRQGVIDRDAFDKASKAMRETGNRFGRTLVELGFVPAEEMEARVVDQIQTIIYSLFAWDSGEYRFEQHENPVDEDIVLNLSTADIILEGTRRLDDMTKVRRALGDLNRVLQTTEDPLLLYQKMTTLSQSEFFILSRVDGNSSINDILSISPIGEDETLRCIYGLASAGVLEAKGGASPAGAAAPEPEPAAPPSKSKSKIYVEPPPRPAAPRVEIPRPDVEVRQAAPPPKPKVEAPAEPTGPSPEEMAVRKDIIEKHASLNEATLYDLLGITVTANDAEIKKAYYAMAKKYHPDRHHSPHLRDVHGLLEELFGKITSAYQTLSSPLEKNRYDSKIRADAQAGATAGGPAGATVAAPDEATESAKKRAAEERFKEGKRHFEEMHFFDAIQCLREAIRLYPKKGYHKLLAQALMKNPMWLRDAEEQFRLALKMDQFDAECYLGLGEIYESEGMTTRAQKMFEQAATYDPENEAVQRKAGDKKGAGTSALKKLFGRKKS